MNEKDKYVLMGVACCVTTIVVGGGCFGVYNESWRIFFTGCMAVATAISAIAACVYFTKASGP